jgi:hypothetical protein
MMSPTARSSEGIAARLSVVLVAGVFYAYPLWTAVGNLLNVPMYFEAQFGASSDQVPWVLLVSDVIRPALIFVGGVLVTWRRGAGAMALVLMTGFAVVCATALSTLAFEKEVELQLVIDFLTNN